MNSRYIPYIVLVVDEFADLIMTAGKRFRTPNCQAQLANGRNSLICQKDKRHYGDDSNFPREQHFRVISKLVILEF